MRGLAPKLLVLAAALAGLLALAAPALAAPAINGIFPMKGAVMSNNKIVAGPDGNMWFTQSSGKEVGRITPSGLAQEFEVGAPGATGIGVGPEGNIWVPSLKKVTKFSPSDPEKTKESFTLNKIANESQIVTGPDGLLWVASTDSVIHFSPKDPEGTEKEVTLAGELSPKDIDVAGSLIAISDNNSTEKRIVTFTTAGLQKDFAIKGGSQGLAGAPGGQIAYSDAGASPEQSGLITPPNPAQSFEMLGDPFGVTYGADQAFWIVRFMKGDLVRVTSSGATTFLPGLPIESARQIAAGRNHTLWVTLEKKEGVIETPSIARVTGVELPPPAPPPGPIPAGPAPIVLPQTTLGKKPKKVVKTTGQTAKVKFAFSASVAGARFECSLGRRVKPKGKKARFVGQAFGKCRSPKTYRLKAGAYRFQVRARLGSLRDSSPAKFNFKVIRVARK